MPKRLTYEERGVRLDQQLRRLLVRNSLQEVMESLRRIAKQEVDDGDINALDTYNWNRALNILIQTDQALYGQHCGEMMLAPKE